ncbi:MAG: 3-methyl-2-oxobutanoate hydroxymethyltransferase [Methylococcales bacterium]|nr:3-methyl-2-oxobutanoate hydroxymethyltransferase [Methylococcales bacterium]
MPQQTQMLSILDLLEMKRVGEKISCLTAYDASFSSLIDLAGIDVMLVGDSLGMVVQGKTTTVPVSIEDMVYHTKCVTNARRRAFVIADLPFLSYFSSENALINAAELMQKGGAQMVKLEGAHTVIIDALVNFGVPVCGHLGLLPQSINQLGEYKVQGKKSRDAEKIANDAKRIEQAGASLLVLECIPAELAKKISQELTIPVIGIGAGLECDGQVLVLYDMLGISIGKRPKFSKNFMASSIGISDAISQFQRAVKQLDFPAAEHSYN